MPPDLTTMQFENVETIHIHTAQGRNDSLHVCCRPSDKQRTDTRLEISGRVALVMENGRLFVRF